jgi:hypothetical protein
MLEIHTVLKILAIVLLGLALGISLMRAYFLKEDFEDGLITDYKQEMTQTKGRIFLIVILLILLIFI